MLLSWVLERERFSSFAVMGIIVADGSMMLLPWALQMVRFGGVAVVSTAADTLSWCLVNHGVILAGCRSNGVVHPCGSDRATVRWCNVGSNGRAMVALVRLGNGRRWMNIKQLWARVLDVIGFGLSTMSWLSEILSRSN
ncbi:uncharacterized protein A4U43_C03F21690 [Asparagus officinalis]|uniref:Uncharacterized protein n=1 Tax=Asparagus officinalis TaxID=4686 RepID=A0A5P1FCX1_ASPOF|nr:uncharacterized protein A4U43_C03F21690 [Asparagus officinalis]